MLRRIVIGALIASLTACGGSGGSPSSAPSSSSSSSSNSSSAGGFSSSSSSSSGFAGGGGASSSAASSASGAAPPVSSSSSNSSSSSSNSSSGEITEDLSFFYFSYDESASTASRDLTHYYLDNQSLPNQSWGRPYEYLNAETFEHFNQESVGLFEVSMGLLVSDPNKFVLPNQLEPDQSLFSLGVNLSGPTLSPDERNSAVITLLVDISGSMGSRYANMTQGNIQSKLDLTQYGMTLMQSTLREGDVINIITFDTSAEVVMEGWIYDGVDFSGMESAIDLLYTRGSTNLDAGIQLAYQVANRQFDANKDNRVVMLTDAYANRGQVDSSVIANNLVINGLEGIRFSGVGIGDSFNEGFLNELTDIGQGNYAALITPNDAERVFNEQFTRFIDDAVHNVKFKLDYPESYTHLVESSSAEETSHNEEDVQAIHFAYNSDQFFFENFTAKDFLNEDEFTLEISFDDDQGERQTLTITKTLAEMLDQGKDQIETAAMVSLLANLVSQKVSCADAETFLLPAELPSDPLYARYLELAQTYCNLRNW